MCKPRPAENSSIVKLMLAEDGVRQLTVDSSREQIAQAFAEFRGLLWHVIELSPDPAPYTLAWNMINLHAMGDLLDFQLGNDTALISVQEKVKEAIQMLP